MRVDFLIPAESFRYESYENVGKYFNAPLETITLANGVRCTNEAHRLNVGATRFTCSDGRTRAFTPSSRSTQIISRSVEADGTVIVVRRVRIVMQGKIGGEPFEIP